VEVEAVPLILLPVEVEAVPLILLPVEVEAVPLILLFLCSELILWVYSPRIQRKKVQAKNQMFAHCICIQGFRGSGKESNVCALHLHTRIQRLRQRIKCLRIAFAYKDSEAQPKRKKKV
jgi:hypothetical protein